MSRYFDYAATQPMRQVAIDAWVEASGALNPGAVYASGRKARSLLDSARETVAELLGCDPIEVIFTSSGTEADNIALQGLYHTRVVQGAPARVVSTPIEHPAVLSAARHLESQGVELDFMRVDSDGHVTDFSALEAPAAVATCMWANNETGAVQPVREVVARAAALGTPVHVDAVQAVGKVPINFVELRATTLAASAHKFGGPRGIGLLLAKRTPAPQPLVHGGGQERGIRPGTVDVASAYALSQALRESVADMDREAARVAALRDRLRAGLSASVTGMQVHTVEPALPGHFFASFAGTDSDSLMLLLDMAGIEASVGSACAAGVNRRSHVLVAMGVEAECGSLRFTLGRNTTAEDVDYAVEVVPEIIAKARNL